MNVKEILKNVKKTGAILKVENFGESFSYINDNSVAENILDLSCYTASNSYQIGDIYNERVNYENWFKRFTVAVDNYEDYEVWQEKFFNEDNKVYNKLSDEIETLSKEKEKLVNEFHETCGKIEELGKEEVDRLKEKLQKEHTNMHNKIQKLIDKRGELYTFARGVTYENWFERKTAKGEKLGKALKKYGYSLEFIEFTGQQERVKRIVQITINPTIQAVAGMSNFAEENSWNGHGGTSCQDTRHEEQYSVSLYGAISDNRLYNVQMNYLEDNEGLEEWLEAGGDLESYQILDSDILHNDNFQDKLKARTLARLWELDEIRVNSTDEEETKDLKMFIGALNAQGFDFDFMVTINAYGSDKTKAELRQAIKVISEQVNII